MAAGQSLAELDKEAIAKIIKGPAGSVVKLKLKRGTNSIDIDVTREKVTIPSVENAILDNNTGYIKLNEFGSRSAEEIDKAIKGLEAQKAENWILDLRGNPGGFLEMAINIAGSFMGNACTLLAEERSGKEIYRGNPGGHVVDGPMVVLIDENSASASEILASALQDNQRLFSSARNHMAKVRCRRFLTFPTATR
jgi:carboxyl-terminal processing protease